MDNMINVTLYTVPQAACGTQQMSWQDVALMLKNQLERSIPGRHSFGHIEFMDNQWFEDYRAQELLERGEVSLPFVLVDGEIASADKVLHTFAIYRNQWIGESERIIRNHFYILNNYYHESYPKCCRRTEQGARRNR